MGSHVLKVQASMKYANFMFIEMPKMIHNFQPASRYLNHNNPQMLLLDWPYERHKIHI